MSDLTPKRLRTFLFYVTYPGVHPSSTIDIKYRMTKEDAHKYALEISKTAAIDVKVHEIEIKESWQVQTTKTVKSISEKR